MASVVDPSCRAFMRLGADDSEEDGLRSEAISGVTSGITSARAEPWTPSMGQGRRQSQSTRLRRHQAIRRLGLVIATVLGVILLWECSPRLLTLGQGDQHQNSSGDASTGRAGGVGVPTLAKYVDQFPEFADNDDDGAEDTEQGECHTAVGGEPCYDEVMWARSHGISEHPEWYPGLSSSSTLEAFQAVVFERDSTKCPKPCDTDTAMPTPQPQEQEQGGAAAAVEKDPAIEALECHTAIEGEPCYDEVHWAATVGISDHPDWYPGLSSSSELEAFQKVVFNSGKCPRPCATHTTLTVSPTTNSPDGVWAHRVPLLFCFSIARVGTYEMDIIQAQREKGQGIFACDDQAVLSLSRTHVGGTLYTLVFEPADVGKSKDGFAANAQLFMNAWRTVVDDGRFKACDYTVKMDPDAVLLPSRLRDFVKPYAGGDNFFFTCNRWPTSPDYPMMYGAMEVVSTGALEAYLPGEQRCKTELQAWPTWGEDLFMTKCLQVLGMQPIDGYAMIQDERCRIDWDGKILKPNCMNKTAAGFHAFKTVASWFDCWGQATNR